MRLMNKNFGSRKRSAFLDYVGKFYTRKDYQSALIILEGIVDMYPDYVPAVADAGTMHTLLGEFDQGRTLLEQAIQMDSSDTITAQALIDNYIFLREFSRASDLAIKTLELSSDEHLLFTAAMASLPVDKERAKSLFRRYMSTVEDKKGFWAKVANGYLEILGANDDYDFHLYLAKQYLDANYLDLPCLKLN